MGNLDNGLLVVSALMTIAAIVFLVLGVMDGFKNSTNTWAAVGFTAATLVSMGIYGFVTDKE